LQRRFRQLVSLYQGRHGSRCPGLREEIVAIQRESLDADKEVSGLDLSGIIADPAYLHIERTAKELVLRPFN
jgi:hypothetical protein